MKTLVKRSEWYRGVTSGFSALRVLEDQAFGKKCCLGFVALACGFTEGDIDGLETPATLSRNIGQVAIFGLVEETTYFDFPDREYENTSVCMRMMTVNDDPKIEDDERELLLTELGIIANIEFEFVD